MRRRSLRLLLAVALFAGLIPALSAAAQEQLAEEAGAVHSPNMTHIKNIEYELRNGGAKNAGTDLEFVTLTLSPEVVEREGLAGAVDADPVAEGLQREYSVAGSYENGMKIIDITVPEESNLIATYDCGVYQGDMQIFNRASDPGMTFATFTQDNSSQGKKVRSDCYVQAQALGFPAKTQSVGTFIADITDPYRPTTKSYIPLSLGSHNGTMHPSGEYFYNSNSELITNARAAAIEVVDIRDFAAPKQIATIPISPRPGLGTDSHDITFNAKGDRAYSAALSQGLIIDTTDPAKPKLLTSFVDPAINVWHQSDPVTVKDPILGERNFLVVEDEVAGATGTGQCPNGGVHVYDITGQLELAPVKVGYWNIDQARAFNVGYSCTAHVFDIHDDTDLMTIAYYQGGVHVVDLSGLVGVALGKSGVGMKQLGFYYFQDQAAGKRASNTWAVKAPRTNRDGSFYLYGNDQNRGFDVYKFDNAAPATTETGQWMTPQQALAMTKQYRALHPKVVKPFCLLN